MRAAVINSDPPSLFELPLVFIFKKQAGNINDIFIAF